MNCPVVEARGLSKAFGYSPVLRAVNLRVGEGEGAVIVGCNGSGKSTLIRVLAGLSSVSAGEALLFGQSACKLQPRDRRRIGLVTHQSLLYPRLTARENLEFYAELYELDHRASRVATLLQRIGLGSVADEALATFSRGMEQRLALARAIIAQPDVLLMDEPFAALDAEGVELTIDLIDQGLNRGCAVVITAHEYVENPRLALNSYDLSGGRLQPDEGRVLTQLKRSAAG
jgi:heme exporter protein A